MLHRSAVLVMAASPALAAAQVPAGSEFQVNTYTTRNPSGISGSMSADGSLVYVWATGQTPLPWQDGPVGFNVKAQRLDAVGNRLGGEFEVTVAATNHPLPNVAATARGDFVVAWAFDQFSGSESHWMARRFTRDGVLLGQELAGVHRSRGSVVATQPDGDFVVAWQQYGATSSADVRARRFDRWGVPLGAEFQVNTYTTGQQLGPAVAFDPQGGFVVVWTSVGQDGSYSGAFGQRFDAAAAPLGAEFRVNTYTSYGQSAASVAHAADGSFVVMWNSYRQFNVGTAAFVQRYSPAGVALGAEFRVSTYTFSYGGGFAMDAAGNFVVAWSSLFQDDGSGVFARRFDASGAPRGNVFRVNTYTTGSQGVGPALSDTEGNLVLAWGDQFGSGLGFFARRFGGLRPAALEVDTAGNDVFEPGESVDVRPSWRNTNGAAQTFGSTAASFTGPLPATYTIEDGSADYGTASDGATVACADCYRVSVPTTTRPSIHWDAVLEEKITPDAQGQDKLWRLHLGGSFLDVPASSPYYPFIETLLHRGVTAGCAAADYCPGSSSTREQMAVFVLVAREGAGYRPPACTNPVFADVPASSAFCPFIEELVRRGVTSGCGGGNYCPGAAVSREQMAVFVLRTLDGALDPPACSTPVFADVPASSPFCRWIEELARRGVVSGCGGGNYCPAAAVTREEMSVFLGVTFSLTLYGP